MQSNGIQERELCIKGEYGGGGGEWHDKIYDEKNRFISKANFILLNLKPWFALLVLVIGCIASGHRISRNISYSPPLQ